MIKFLLGESRPLEFEITHQDGLEFIINKATYSVYKGNELIETGDMDICDHIVSHVFTPQDRGYYLFELSYTIGPTTRVARYHINVD